MNETTLSALVVLQLMIIGAFEVFDNFRDQPPPPFFNIDVTEIEVVRLLEQGKEVVLRRISSGDWVLEGGLPADSGKANKLLDSLANAGKADWPVATTLISSARFGVTEDAYKKRLVLERAGGEAVLDLYLGTAPNLGQTHARVSGGLGIYAIRFAEHEAGVDDKDWLNKSLLAAVGELSLVQRLESGGGGWTMRRGEGGWHSNDIENLQAEAAIQLAGRLKNLRVLSAADASVKTSTEDQLFHYKLSDADGSYELKFFVQGEESLAVKSSRMPQYFEVADYLRDVLDADQTKLSTP